jgi:hypothetical protein
VPVACGRGLPGRWCRRSVMDDHAEVLARDLPETVLHVTSRRPTTQPSAAPFTCTTACGREVLCGVVNHRRIDGMQGVRGSTPLSSTRPAQRRVPGSGSSVSRSHVGTDLGGCSPRRSTAASRWAPTHGRSTTSAGAVGRARRRARGRSASASRARAESPAEASPAAQGPQAPSSPRLRMGCIGGASLRLDLDRL